MLPFFVFLTKDIAYYIVAFSQSGIDFYSFFCGILFFASIGNN